MGVAGAGKSTVGRALADRLGWVFEDADDYHTPAALAKMSRGEGLSDADRGPWLDRLAGLVRQRAAGGPPTVLACSALRAAHRARLGTHAPDVAVAWLDVEADVLRDRLGAREGHVAGPDLLPSQLATLEPPSGVLRLDGSRPVGALVDEVCHYVQDRRSDTETRDRRSDTETPTD